METILVSVVVGVCALVASSMIYVLVWNLFRVYFTKYMDKYFDHKKEMYAHQTKILGCIVIETMKSIENIYRLGNNLPVKEETVKEEKED